MSDPVKTKMNLQAASTLEVNVLRACAHCGAPGFWHNTPGVNVGCYAPDKVTMLGQDSVGATCPNCGAARSAFESLGEVWRAYKFPRWVRVIDRIVISTLRDLFRGPAKRRSA